VVVGAPRYVPRVLDSSGITRLQGEMESELKSLFQRARTLLRERES
jgi:hypothetical protein